MFRIELLPARHGDCILISYGPVQRPALILIDGGPSACYPVLARRLACLERASRKLELVVITHIDSDHIGGIISLLGDRALGVTYKDLWFNGWKQLSGRLEGWRCRQGEMPAKTRSPLEGHHAMLRVKQTGASLNATFAGRAICVAAGEDAPEVLLDHGLKLTLLSPDVPALEALRTAWRKALRRIRVDPDDESAVSSKLAADRRYRGPLDLSGDVVHDLAEVAIELDDAVANGSSIAFIAEYEGKRCAFLGDAHMPIVEARVHRLARRYGERRLRLDAVKVSHHGSKGNTTASFLKLVDCSRFLISTDGSQFGHPDDEAIARLLEFGSKPTQLYFNYRNAKSDRWTDAGLQATLGYSVTCGVEQKGIAVDLL